MMLFWIILFLIIAYLVYLDANKRGMNGLLWGIMILIPMVNILFLILYVIIRETNSQKPISEGRIPTDILKERYAKGEISSEQFKTMIEEIKNS
ncbi:MAG TPA: SHOCT domain-containing protein [Methanospirillum sp.]|nr:SHOCT domain-containing protein [Methanospirillum sp.]